MKFSLIAILKCTIEQENNTGMQTDLLDDKEVVTKQFNIEENGTHIRIIKRGGLNERISDI